MEQLSSGLGRPLKELRTELRDKIFDAATAQERARFERELYWVEQDIADGLTYEILF